MISRSAVPCPAASLVARKVGEETILVSAKGDMLHTLNATGSFIWENIDGKRSIGDILVLMREEFELPDERAEVDVSRFLEELAEKGVVNIGS
jgi:hypothetical protein